MGRSRQLGKRGMNSSLADQTWKQFGQMFGARWADQFGPKPSDQWASALHSLRSDQLRGALSKLQNAPIPYPGWLPSLPEFMAFARSIQAMPVARQQDRQPKWLSAVNGLFLSWMFREIQTKKRKIFFDDRTSGIIGKPRAIPDAELFERRETCKRLANDFEQMECEGDPAANKEWLKKSFDAQMELIPVGNPA